MKNTTAIVISFLRPAYTKACIRSLREQYPEIQIVVGENGHHNKELEAVCREVGAKYVQLPFDSGICVARNTLVRDIDTEYVLVGDDDFLYDREAGVDRMVSFLERHPEYDLIGGRVRQSGIVRNYQGMIERRPTHFQSYAIDPETQAFDTDETGLRYCPADLTFNYFVARTAKVKTVPWDEEIKVAYEHFSWFWDFKEAGGRVAFTPDAIVIHKPEHIAAQVYGSKDHPTYMAYRNRKSDKERFFGKYGLSYTIGMNGNKTYSPHHIVERRKNDTKHVDFCITTFKRPKALEKLLHSIAEIYPMANIYVADQNERLDREFYKKLKSDLFDMGLAKRVSVEHLPYDCGLSYARNHLVLTTPNPYKLILDDDMVFTEEADIGKMVKLLEAHPRAGVVGGLVRQMGHDLHFEFNLEKKDGTLLQVPDGNPWKKENGITYRKTGCVLNFALMRKELFNYIQWDPELKVTEHMDFYWRMRGVPMYILYTPDVAVDHPPAEREGDYKEMRQREEFLVRMMRKNGVTRVKYLNGQVRELMPDNSVKRYKEKPQ
jgi:GT2 family glycosyltransferase